MAIKKFIILVFLTSLNSSYSQTKKSEVIAEYFKFKGAECAIFPETYKDFPIFDNRFTPTHAQIGEAEQLLKSQLNQINVDSGYQSLSQGPMIHKKLKHYKRQYFGFIDKNGHHILLINCFWSEGEADKSWLLSYLMVLDGGSYYWNIKVDLDNQKLYDLTVNGNG